MKYLKGATNVSIWYPKCNVCNLVGYFDFNYAGCKTDPKRNCGTCHIFGNGFLSWSCKKKARIALSTKKTEYIVI